MYICMYVYIYISKNITQLRYADIINGRKQNYCLQQSRRRRLPLRETTIWFENVYSNFFVTFCFGKCWSSRGISKMKIIPTYVRMYMKINFDIMIRLLVFGHGVVHGNPRLDPCTPVPLCYTLCLQTLHDRKLSVSELRLIYLNYSIADFDTQVCIYISSMYYICS